MRTSGFTLLELSIALVIIGLITGGVLVGRDLIHTAELRSVITQVDQTKAAVNTFYLKYNCIPGDCGSATQLGFVGDGNDNGKIDWTPDGDATDAEQFTFWEHLSKASLINGTYTGVTGPGGSRQAVIGVNVPASKIAGTGFSAISISSSFCCLYAYFPGFEGNMLSFGKSTGNETSQPAISGYDAMTIDQKADDGKPGSGIIQTQNPADQSCASNDYDPAIATYSKTSSLVCMLDFMRLF